MPNEPAIRWLPWIHPRVTSALRKSITITAAHIMERHWGVLLEDTETNALRMYILDIRGIMVMTATLRHELNNANTFVYYRGQDKAWALVPSLYRKLSSVEDRIAARERMLEMLDVVKETFAPGLSTDQRTALAQHYSCPTDWLDVVDTPQMASWFAYHRPATWEAVDNGVGYIMVVASERRQGTFSETMDLRTMPAAWLRPHIQQALSVRALPADGSVPDMSHMLVMTYIVPRPLLYQWSAYEALKRDIMFPNPKEDLGLEQATKAQIALQDSWPNVWYEQRYRIFVS